MIWKSVHAYRLDEANEDISEVCVPPQMSRETLNKSAKSFNEATINRSKRNNDPGTNAKSVEMTLEEVKKKWIVRELDPDTLPESAILSPRFSIQPSSPISMPR